MSGTAVHVYNDHGEPVSETDARGITVTRTVDALDRVTAVTYPSADLNVSYTYDDPAVPFSKGRLTRIARDSTRYDRFGRLLQSFRTGSCPTARAFNQRYFPSAITLAGPSNLLSWIYTTDAVAVVRSAEPPARICPASTS